MVAIGSEQSREEEKDRQGGADDHHDEIGILKKALPIKDEKAKEGGDA